MTLTDEQTAQVALLNAKIEMLKKQCELNVIKLNQEIATITNSQ